VGLTVLRLVDPPRLLARFLLTALGCALLVWLCALAAPLVRLDTRLAFVLAYLSVTAEIMALALAVPRLRALHAGCAVLFAAVPLCLLMGAPATALHAAVLTFALGVAATLLGAGLGARIERPGQIAAVAIVSALADLWSVFDPSAPSARFAEDALARPDQLTIVALPFPLLGTPLIPALIGAGDVLFVALYVAAYRSHRLPIGKLAVALVLAFCVGLLGLLASERALPLLPLLGVAAVASDPAARSLHAREWRTVAMVSALLILAIVLRLTR
jgi:hypothetical protein